MRNSLRAVAAKADVSTATVSRILNNVNVAIAPETQQRVRRIAAEMGYQPHRLARALVTGRTQTAALWIANLRSSYYTQVMYFMREEIRRHKYDLLVNEAYPQNNDTLDTSRLLSWPVDGILAVELPRANIPGLERSLLGGKPFATMGVYVTQGADFVHVDFLDTVIEGVRHLHTIGCRRIAYLVPNWFEWFHQCRDARLYGYEAVMAEVGQKPEYILTWDEKRWSVADALKAHVERHGHPDGVFCFNDDMTIGAYRALRDLNLQIPEDVALLGCDGIEDTAYLDPPLATIAQPLEKMCATAWEFLERRMREPNHPPQELTLQPSLQLRGSVQR